MDFNFPKISIITPTYNQGQYIEQTIRSVLDQDYPNLEYIIIDGGSTDNTLEIIKKYEKYLKFWISEKDEGQAQAINKGLQYCTGEIFNWLNSDDYLEPGALNCIADIFSKEINMVAGKVRLFNDNKTLQFVEHQKLSAKGLMYWSPGVQFVQPGVWIRKNSIEQCGGIDESFHYCFDWDLYIRYLSKFPSVAYTSKLLINFRYHDQSKTVKEQKKFKEEEQLIIFKMSTNNDNKKLKSLAIQRIQEKKWREYLNRIINDTNKSKILKIILISKKIGLNNLPNWRTTGGALKKILIERN